MMTHPLGLLMLLAAADTSPLTAEMHQDFRGKKFNDQLFRLEDGNLGKYVKAEDAGLRLSLPPRSGVKKPVGIQFRFQLRGDFHISVAYELLKTDQPQPGSNHGLTAYLMVDSPTKDGITFGCTHQEKERAVYGLRHMIADEKGKRRLKEFQSFPAEAKNLTGMLRLVRTGSLLTVSVADGNTSNFRDLSHLNIGTEPVTVLRIAADPGNAAAGVDARVLDVRVRAQELTKPGTPAPGGGRRWILWGLVGAIAILVIAFLAIRFWAAKRRAVQELERQASEARKKKLPTQKGKT